MKNNIISLSLLLSQCAIANELSSCPNISEIDHQQGVYTTVNGKWLGTSLGMENNGNVHSFIRTTYIPYKNFNLAIGMLAYCTYSLDSGMIDMHFRDQRSLRHGGIFISLMGHAHWSKNTEISYGGDNYVCTATLANQCTFTRLTDDAVADYKNKS